MNDTNQLQPHDLVGIVAAIKENGFDIDQLHQCHGKRLAELEISDMKGRDNLLIMVMVLIAAFMVTAFTGLHGLKSQREATDAAVRALNERLQKLEAQATAKP